MCSRTVTGVEPEGPPTPGAGLNAGTGLAPDSALITLVTAFKQQKGSHHRAVPEGGGAGKIKCAPSCCDVTALGAQMGSVGTSLPQALE